MVMTEGSARPVAQVGSDPQLVAFGDDVRRQALMPGWDFQSAQSNEPVPVAVPYRWSWADVLRPMMVKAYDVVDPVKASYKTVPRSSYEDLESFRKA
jgi:gentisate 1,2-dioxygenase